MRRQRCPHDRGARPAFAARPRRLPRSGQLLVQLLLSVAAAAPLCAQRFAPDTTEVLSVSFAGAERVPAHLLRTAIMTTATRCLSAALQPLCWFGLSRDRHYLDLSALAADVFRLRVFYYQHGFREARVELDTTRGAGGMHVRFRIDEGPPVLVGRLHVEGAADVDPAVTRALPVRPGEPFSMIDFEATRDTLIARLANRGYAAADVLANYEIPGANRQRADVEFQLIPGSLTRFGEIEITGAERVSPAVVRRMLTFTSGDVYSRQALLRSQRNIFALEVFRHAEITPLRTADDTLLGVRVQVNEGDLHRARLGVGLSTLDYLSTEGRWVSRNFLGGARRLEVGGRISNLVATPLRHVQPPFEPCAGIYCELAGSLYADFSQPWFFGPLNTLGAGAFIERFSLPAVYVRTSRGAYASVRRSVLGNGVLSAGYRRELTRLESDGDLIFCVNFVACEEREIDVLREPHWLSPLSLSLAVDRSNSLFAPTRGYIARVDAEYGGAVVGSEFEYARVVGELSAYHDPFRGVVIATRVRPGWARTFGEPGRGLGLHPQKRFFAGGPSSVRGFAQYRLGPKLLTVNAARTLAQPVEHGGAGCSAQQINAGTCAVDRLAAAAAGALDVRPVGGAASLEANLEVRFPVWADKVRAAAFIDFGQVWREASDLRLRDIRATPGAGIRYFSPIGPVRIDVGYNGGGSERLTVMTTEVCDARLTPCGDILPDRVYDAGVLANRRKLRTLTPVDWQPFDSFMDRLQFHFSIGQAF